MQQQVRGGGFLSLFRSEYSRFVQEGARIYATEGGARGLWQGAVPNITRAALLTASQIGSYDTAKSTILESSTLLKETVFLHFVCSMIAGVAAAVVTSPVDLVKSRMMMARSASGGGGGGGAVKYKGMADCALQTVRAEGVFALYKGFNAQWLRIGPHTTITFLVFEQLRKAAGFAPV